MNHDVYVYLFIMSAVTFAIRILPITLIRKPIKNQFIRSFLYYVPYVTLAVMTFPAMIYATQVPLAGGAALILGILLAYAGASLFTVAAASAVCVFFVEYFY